MAIRKIVELGDEVLRKKSRRVEKFDKREWMLLKDMAETMYEAEGVGLAAPQVGILKRMVVIDIGDGLIELINPEILETEGTQDGPEGCLSVPGRRGKVERPMRVVVAAQDRKGREFTIEGEGLMARALCHEIDHLEGIVYVDRMSEEIFGDDDEEDAEDEE